MRETSVHVCLALAMVGTAACSAPVVDEEDVADAGDGVTRASVLVEKLSAADGVTQTSATAKFMRVAASVDFAMVDRAVGYRLDLPSTLPGCMVLTDADEATALSSLGQIVLLDAGDDVSLRAGEHVVPLDRRAFPDVGGAVFGQFYSSRDVASELPAPARYALSTSGSFDLDHVSLEAEAPGAPEDVRVGGVPLAEDLVLADGSSVLVTWRPGGAPGDVVLVDVSADATGGLLRCAFADEGQGSVPGELVHPAALGAGANAAITIEVHRVREQALSVPALDHAELRFDLAVAGHGVLAPQ
jgi:hypothetical protein